MIAIYIVIENRIIPFFYRDNRIILNTLLIMNSWWWIDGDM